ncbi:MAG: SDR family oxidoreductase [Pseudomonadales bacterium]|jgi:short-subunit dehydrogenase|nr:SDR family oxidoreductase [Pseudomonadales bacterium]
MSETQTRTVLVTGASAGIGQALARQFAAAGHDLVLVARRADALRALAEELRARHGVRAVDLPLDLAQARAADALLVALEQRQLSVDILVNNAGVLEAGAFRLANPEDLERMIQLNVSALTLIARALLEPMVSRGWGRILNVASVAGFQPVPGLATYAATKAFVLALTEAMSEELKGTGVTVTALCPGITDTEMAQRVNDVNPALAIPPAFMSSVEAVAREGFEATMKGEVIRVPGLANRLGTLWTQVQPRWLVRTLGGIVGRRLLADR